MAAASTAKLTGIIGCCKFLGEHNPCLPGRLLHQGLALRFTRYQDLSCPQPLVHIHEALSASTFKTICTCLGDCILPGLVSGQFGSLLERHGALHQSNIAITNHHHMHSFVTLCILPHSMCFTICCYMLLDFAHVLPAGFSHVSASSTCHAPVLS